MRNSELDKCRSCQQLKKIICKQQCRNCYERELRKKNPEFHKRQLENCRKWNKAHKEYKAAYDKSKRVEAGEIGLAKRRVYSLKWRYGLTIKDRDKLFENGCAICGKLTGLTVDHNHDTNKIRGCLCRVHNLLIGRLGDNFEDALIVTARILHYLGKEQNRE